MDYAERNGDIGASDRSDKMPVHHTGSDTKEQSTKRQNGLELEKGSRWRCILSPDFFNQYDEYITRKSNLDDLEEAGVRIGGRWIGMLMWLAESKVVC